LPEIESSSAREPEKRHAQRELAREVTRLVHGATAVQEAETAAEKLFKGDLTAMSVAELLQIFPTCPRATSCRGTRLARARAPGGGRSGVVEE
jgi:tyrosyl-tRNA synthetase